MSAVVVNLFAPQAALDFSLRPIEIDEWSERLIRASTHWLSLRRCDVFTFLVIAPSVCRNSVILEFDQNGRDPQIVSTSTPDAGDRLLSVLRESVLPGMAFQDRLRGHLLTSPSLKYPVQYLFLPLPSDSQKFAAIVF